RKAETLEWDRKLRAPSLAGSLGSDRPHGVPFIVRLAVGEYEPVHQGAGRISGKEEGVALVPIGVENDGNPVIGSQCGIARHLCSDYPVWLGVEAHDANVKVVSIVEKRDFGSFTGALAVTGLS